MTRLADQLFDHLEQERLAITSGAYDTLQSLLAAKATLFSLIETNPPRRDQLDLIGRRAARNLRLLDAALRGIRDAADRLAALRSVQTGFDTYGADGRKTVHSAGRPTVEHKA